LLTTGRWSSGRTPGPAQARQLLPGEHAATQR
jgi:hypothetical protein